MNNKKIILILVSFICLFFIGTFYSIIDHGEDHYPDNIVIDIARPLVMKFEGFRAVAYPDGSGWSIGYGHHGSYEGETITKDEAMGLLNNDLKIALAAVNKLVTVPLNNNQKAALTSWTFNFNERQLRNSTMLEVLNKGIYSAVPGELKRWVYATVDGEKVIRNGLVARRKAEGELWNAPIQP
jgi:lysozyme